MRKRTFRAATLVFLLILIPAFFVMLFFATRVDTLVTDGAIDLQDSQNAPVYLFGEWRVCDAFIAPGNTLWDSARTASINQNGLVPNDVPRYSLQSTIKNCGKQTDILSFYNVNYVTRIYVNDTVVYDTNNDLMPESFSLGDTAEDTLTVTMWMTGGHGVQGFLNPLILILTSQSGAAKLSAMRIVFKYVLIGIYLAYALVCLMMYLKNRSAIHFLLLSLSGLIRMLALESYLAPQLLAEWIHLPAVWMIRFAMLFIAMASTLNVGVIYILYKQHLYKKLTVAMLIAVNVVLLLALVFGHGVLTLLLNASGYVLYLLCLAAVGRAWLSGEKSAGYMFTAFLLYMISLLFFFGSRIMAGFGSTLGVYNVFGAVGEFIFYGVTILAFFVRYIESYFQNLSQIRTLDNQLSDKERSLSEAYGQLTRFEAARTRMLRDFAHDLKTPVTSVLGYLSMMASGEITQTHEVRQTAGKMLTRVRQIRDMSHNLSGLMTLEQGEIKMQMTPCAAADIMAGIQPHYGQKCAAAGLALTVSNNASGNVLADMTQIMRVFDNLIDNAVRHTPTGGHITVSAEDCGNNGMRFCVADTGCGIPEDQQPYVFGRFYRADASRAQSGVHQGLGLAICYEIIKAHRGMISVESVPGQGAKFCFTLKRPAEEC